MELHCVILFYKKNLKNIKPIPKIAKKRLDKFPFSFTQDEICQSWQHSCDRCSMLFPTSIHLSRHKVQNHFNQIVAKKKPVNPPRSYFYQQTQSPATKTTTVSKVNLS